MSKMTLEEKIGQLNLPVAGSIVTGDGKSTGVETRIAKGEVGGLFNVKGAADIRKYQQIAVEQSRLGIPLIISTYFIPVRSVRAEFEPIRQENDGRLKSIKGVCFPVWWPYMSHSYTS